MPPKTKPQIKTKEVEEGKEKAKTEKKAKKAVVVALLLFVMLAAFAWAQTGGGTGGTQNKTQADNKTGMPDADKALSGFKGIAKEVVLGARAAIALAFWGAFGIMVAHFAVGKLAPTRFQRLGAFWDGLERAKDIIYGYAWLFLLIFAIYAAIGIIVNGGTMDVNTFSTVVRWMMVDPIVDMAKELGIISQGRGP